MSHKTPVTAAPEAQTASEDIDARLLDILVDAEGLGRLAREDDEYLRRLVNRLVTDIQSVRERLELCEVKPHPEWAEAFGPEAACLWTRAQVGASWKLHLRQRGLSEPDVVGAPAPVDDPDDDIPRNEEGFVDWDFPDAKSPRQRRAEAATAASGEHPQ